MLLCEIVLITLLCTVVKSKVINSTNEDYDSTDETTTERSLAMRIMKVSTPNNTRQAKQMYFSDTDSNSDHMFEFKSQKPLVNYEKCKENEWFYPGDVDGDWVCDCRPGYIYNAVDGKCYEAFMQGPCKEEEIYVITERNTLPKCVVNDCRKGEVLFNDECTEFKSEWACLKMHKNFVLPRNNLKLEVDPASRKLACTDEANGIFCDKYQCKIVKFEEKKIYYKNSSIKD